MTEAEAACAAARVKAVENRKAFADAFGRDTSDWALERDDQEFLARITTREISGRALLSNFHVNRRAQEALIDAAVDIYRRNRDCQWLWITICWDRGVTWEREPFIDLMSLRRIVYGHLSRCGLEGFGVIEFDTWKNLTGEPGRRIVAHSHFLGFPADGEPVDVPALERELLDRRALPNTIGAPSVMIDPMTLTAADFARVGRYMFKSPAYAKMLRPETDDRRGRLKPVGHSQGSVARLIEIFSRVEVGDVLFSIGGGRAIANRIREEVAHEIRDRRGATEAPSRDEVIRHWRRIRLTNGRADLREPTIITRKEDRTQNRSDGVNDEKISR